MFIKKKIKTIGGRGKPIAFFSAADRNKTKRKGNYNSSPNF